MFVQGVSVGKRIGVGNNDRPKCRPLPVIRFDPVEEALRDSFRVCHPFFIGNVNICNRCFFNPKKGVTSHRACLADPDCNITLAGDFCLAIFN